MKKFVLPVALFVALFLLVSSNVYAGNEEATSSTKSSSGYDPKCWNTHMNDDIAVCNRSLLSCMKPCPGQDLKANAICLNACSKVHTDCLKSASAAYKVCIENERQAKKQSESKQLKRTQTETPKKLTEDGNPFNIFEFNPLETWRNIQGLLDIEEDFPALLQSSQFLTESAEVPVEIPRPPIAFDPDGKPWDFLPGYVPHESIYLGNTMRISEGTKVSAGGVNQGSDKKLLNLEEGEVEIIKNELNVTDSEYDGIKTQNATVLSIQTHYWVSYDKNKNQTTVVVYEGKVEVKTNDGKTTIITPDGVEPGVVLIAQKLSLPKLAVAGFVIVVVISSIIFFLKRKFSSKKSGKKK